MKLTSLIISGALAKLLPKHQAYRNLPVLFTDGLGKQTETPASKARRLADDITVAPEEIPCPVALDVLFIQDITGSYRNLLHVFQAQVQPIVDEINVEYPGSHFALSSFQDLPFPTLGEIEDICLTNVMPFSPNSADLVTAYYTLMAQGGWDLPEFQYGALMYTALDDSLGWRGTKTVDGVTIAKVVILITDADSHVDGDAAGAPYHLPENPGALPRSCREWDYPSVKQTGDALKARGIVPAFVVPASDSALADVYTEFIEETLGAGMGTVVALGDGPSALIAAIDEAIYNAVEISCDNPQACKVRENIVSRDLSHSTKNEVQLFHDWVLANLGSAPDVNQVMFVSHTDKPVIPFGFEISMDYCYWKHTDLVDWASFWLVYQIEENNTRSGGDFAENQFGAVIQALGDVEWLTAPEDDCRCVYILTDAFFHEAGDFIGAPAFDPAAPECKTGDYPSVAQFATTAEQHTKCLHVVTDSAVETFWVDLEIELRTEGYTGSYTVELLPKSTRRLRAADLMERLAPQESRNLQGLVEERV